MGNKKIHALWVDWNRKVISFREARGFEMVTFKTRSALLAFAVEKSNAGFGIQ